MIEIIKMMVLKLFNMLPDNPFSKYYLTIDMTDYQYINWILPLDICSAIMLGWLACIIVYYIFIIVRWFVMQFITVIAKSVPLFG